MMRQEDLHEQVEAQRDITIKQTDMHIRALEEYISVMLVHPDQYTIDEVTGWCERLDKAITRFENLVPDSHARVVESLFTPKETLWTRLLNLLK